MFNSIIALSKIQFANVTMGRLISEKWRSEFQINISLLYFKSKKCYEVNFFSRKSLLSQPMYLSLKLF